MWQDKHVYVLPLDAVGAELDRRELADLAVVVQLISSHGVKRSMWILQAKVSRRPLSAFSGSSSLKEIELFEQTDCFTLLDGNNNPLGRSYYAFEFGGPQHWSYLTFHKNHRLAMKKGDLFPVMRRWPGSKSGPAPAVHSFCDSLFQACTGTLGVSVDYKPEDDEWSRLYKALMDDASVRLTTGYAKTPGNPTGSVMQLAACALPQFSNYATILFGNDDYFSWHRYRRLLKRNAHWASSPAWHTFGVRHGRWGGDCAPGEADRILIDGAFGDSPPNGGGGEGSSDDGSDDGNEWPGFQHIIFVDVWSESTGGA